jgi:hypothetical protein
MNGIEVYYNTPDLHPCDLLGILEKEAKLIGVINNYPLRRTAVPYYSMELYAGNKRRLRVYIKDGDLNIVNLTGAVCVFSFRHVKGGPLIFSKSTSVSSEGMIGSADQGECFFYLNPEDTSSLDIAQYVFDVTVTLTGNDGPYTTAEGVVNLLQSVAQN